LVGLRTKKRTKKGKGKRKKGGGKKEAKKKKYGAMGMASYLDRRHRLGSYERRGIFAWGIS